MKRFSALVGLLIVAIMVVNSGWAHAADSVAPVGSISVSPAIQDTVLAPTAKTAAFQVQLHNDTGQPVTFRMSSNDFTSLNQTGGIAFLGSSIDDATRNHGLSGLLTLSAGEVTVPAGKTVAVTATIADVAKLAVGGHYAAVLARVVNPPESGATNHVAINQVFSSLIFLQTAGQGTKTLKLLPPDIGSLALHLPDSIDLVYRATGNTQTVPRGQVTISHGDRVVKQGIINENSSLVLPGSTRLFPTSLRSIGRSWLPGKYTVTVEYRYEGSLGVTTYRKSVLYLQPAASLALIAIAALLILAIVMVRRHWGRLRRLPKVSRKVLRLNRPVSVSVKAGKITVRDSSDKAHSIKIRRL